MTHSMDETSTERAPSPPDEPPAGSSALAQSSGEDTGLAALRGRLGRLLLTAAPATGESAERPARRVQQLRAYIERARARLESPQTANTPAEALGHPDPTRTDRDTLTAEIARLIQALDDYLEHPQWVTRRAALEQTLDAIVGPPPETKPQTTDVVRERPTRASPPLGVDHDRPTHPPQVELHRLDAAERDWWQRRFERLQRRVTLALVLCVAALVGLLALHLQSDRPWPASETPSDRGRCDSAPAPIPPQASSEATPERIAADPRAGAEALLRLLQPLGTTPEGLAALIQDWSTGPAATLETLRERAAELDLKLMRLDARLAAWENTQASATARAGQSAVTTEASTRPTGAPEPSAARDEAPQPTPAAAIALRPSFGIQLATMRDEAGARAFAQRSGLAVAQLYMERSGPHHRVILGFYPDAERARSALAALPAALQKTRPLVRSFETPQALTPLETQTARPDGQE